MKDGWIKCGLPFGTIYSNEKGKELDELDSFCKRHLNIPGTLIDTKIGIFLVGNINKLGGVCDDCRAFDVDTIVRRYKIVWKKDE